MTSFRDEILQAMGAQLDEYGRPYYRGLTTGLRPSTMIVDMRNPPAPAPVAMNWDQALAEAKQWQKDHPEWSGDEQ